MIKMKTSSLMLVEDVEDDGDDNEHGLETMVLTVVTGKN